MNMSTQHLCNYRQDGYDWYETRPKETLRKHKETCLVCRKDGLPVTMINLCEEGKRIQALVSSADRNRHKATPFGIPLGA